MPRHATHALAVCLTAATLAAANLFAALPAGAVIQGTSSSLGSYTVRLAGNGFCTGVAIARRAVATAAHCAAGMHVVAGGHSIRVSGISRSAVLDDGRHVHVSGDAAILKLSSALPFGVSAAPIGDGGGDSFTIAGYGATDERARGAFGALHEARLVPASARALVDPNRSGSTGASACFGDSGGPVMRGGMLVGVITRAAHPSPHRACGHLTRWAAITVSGTAQALAVAAADEGSAVAEPRSRKARHHARRGHTAETRSAGLFGSWFAEKVEVRKFRRHRHARQ